MSQVVKVYLVTEPWFLTMWFLALVLAIVISTSPEVLVLDEPTRGLDYEAKTFLMRELHRLARDANTAATFTDFEFLATLAAARVKV